MALSQMIDKCASAFAGGEAACHPQFETDYTKKLSDLATKITDSILTVRSVLRPSDQTRIVLQSYPSPFPYANENRYTGRDLLTKGGCPLHAADFNWFADTVYPDLAATLRTVAKSSNADFLDLSQVSAAARPAPRPPARPAGATICSTRSPRTRPNGCALSITRAARGRPRSRFTPTITATWQWDGALHSYSTARLVTDNAATPLARAPLTST